MLSCQHSVLSIKCSAHPCPDQHVLPHPCSQLWCERLCSLPVLCVILVWPVGVGVVMGSRQGLLNTPSGVGYYHYVIVPSAFALKVCMP